MDIFLTNNMLTLINCNLRNNEKNNLDVSNRLLAAIVWEDLLF
jgi:hypothetical protein